MLDWRILGASFAALIVISAIFLGGSGTSEGTEPSQGGIGDMLSGIIEKISSWFSGSPFGGFFEQPVARSTTTHVILFPQTFVFSPESEVDIESGKTSLSGFSGTMTADFTNETLLLEAKGSSLKVSLPLESVILEDIRISFLSLKDTRFEVVPDMETDNGTIELNNFLGRMEFRSDRIELFGNVTTLKAQIGSLRWELI